MFSFNAEVPLKEIKTTKKIFFLEVHCSGIESGESIGLIFT